MKYVLISIALVAACAAPAVFAKGSSHPKSGADDGQFIPIEQAQRVMHFTSERIWQNVEGEILICPWAAKPKPYAQEKECLDKNDKSAWMPMMDLKVPGHEISGISHHFAGSSGNTQLLVFWRKVQPKQPEATKATPAAPVPANVVLNTDKITITTGKVVVQRKR